MAVCNPVKGQRLSITVIRLHRACAHRINMYLVFYNPSKYVTKKIIVVANIFLRIGWLRRLIY